jgi:Fe(II)/alpha-ketoglutarate-dependent arginine beta-hydroxylase
MNRFVLTAPEIASLQQMTAAAAARYDSAEDPEFLVEASLLAHEMPRRLRAVLNRFRLCEPDPAVLVLSGFPVDQGKSGPTPGHWRTSRGLRSPVLEEEILFILAGSLLGDCIGWSTQQGGRILHDVLPIRGMEQEQISTGSEQPISWHTEDAFHPLRGDYVGLLCLRNDERVPTTFASLHRVCLDDEQWRLLFEPHFTIEPDLSHRPETEGTGQRPDGVPAASDPRRREKTSVLSGDPRSPYIRIDPYFMPPAEDERAQQALEALIRAIDGKLQEVILAPGDLCFIDNFKCVHGRRAFKARYDGRDRWLKRVNISRDLRKSRAERESATSRILQ